jgi:stearoyl-CoA desaturase (Delta-9 desaturase)
VPRILTAILVGLLTSQIGIVCTTVYLHRTVTHKAVRMGPYVAWAFRFLIWISTGISPREWAAVHRRHHAFTDVEGDPHSPLLLGLWRVELTNAYLYRKIARDKAVVERYAKDLPADRWDRVLFDHDILGLSAGSALLFLLLGWRFGLIAAAVHASSYLLLNGSVNAFCHWNGKRAYANKATNLQSIAFLTAGEGLHNNHHAAPTSARLAHRRGEIDPGWWLISLLCRLGLAEVRLSEVKLTRIAAASVRSV